MSKIARVRLTGNPSSGRRFRVLQRRGSESPRRRFETRRLFDRAPGWIPRAPVYNKIKSAIPLSRDKLGFVRRRVSPPSLSLSLSFVRCARGNNDGGRRRCQIEIPDRSSCLCDDRKLGVTRSASATDEQARERERERERERGGGLIASASKLFLRV